MLSKRHSITRSLYYDKVSHFLIYVPLHQQYHTINWLTTIFSLTSVSANFSTSNKLFLSTFLVKTRGSAIAEEPRDALRQLKYYGRLLTELLTRSSANPEEPCEHNVSWNHVKCCANVRRIACENTCNRWMTFSVIPVSYTHLTLPTNREV